jgi:hypothetical protein
MKVHDSSHSLLELCNVFSRETHWGNIKTIFASCDNYSRLRIIFNLQFIRSNPAYFSYYIFEILCRSHRIIAELIKTLTQRQYAWYSTLSFFFFPFQYPWLWSTREPGMFRLNNRTAACRLVYWYPARTNTHTPIHIHIDTHIHKCKKYIFYYFCISALLSLFCLALSYSSRLFTYRANNQSAIIIYQYNLSTNFFRIVRHFFVHRTS